MSSPYADLGRPPLREPDLRRAVVVPGGLWTEVRVVAETGSTNADLAALAREGAPEGLVLVAERQSAGRGRLGRVWESPPRAGLAVSMLLRPEEVPVSRFGWLPLLAGVALAETVRRVTELDATLKWPNDLLLPGDRKCAGILAEAVGSQAAGSQAVVLGVGLNVSLKEHELPRPDATSLKLAGAAAADRGTLLKQLLRSVEQWYGRWRAAGGAGIRADYLAHCGTIGRVVKVGLPDGTTLEGLAVDVDDDGRLVVEAGGELRPVAAGDVVHVR